MTRHRFPIVCAALIALALPASASAEMLEIYGNGHGSYLGGDAKELSYFANNDAGLGAGFTIGAEVLQIDVFLDANFHLGGSQWNQLGIGFDLDLVPGALFVAPAGQLVYFFGKQEDDTDGVQGLFPRAGVQVGADFATFLYAGLEGYAGYVVSLPDPEAGFAYIAGAYLGVAVDIL